MAPSMAIEAAGPPIARCPYCLDPLRGRQRRSCDAPACWRRQRSDYHRQLNHKKIQARGFGLGVEERWRRRSRTLRYCQNCGDRIWPGSNIETREFCRPCNDRRARQDRARRSARAPAPSTTIWTAGPCEFCGVAFVATRPGGRNCSQLCKMRGSRRRRRLGAEPQPADVWTAGPCAQCGALFVSTQRGAAFCSRRCRRRIHGWRRRYPELRQLEVEAPALVPLIRTYRLARAAVNQYYNGGIET